LSPLEEKEFIVKWGVEFPPAETVEYVERFWAVADRRFWSVTKMCSVV
jgi:hypothetical protein